jgi:hypothetical protein
MLYVVMQDAVGSVTAVDVKTMKAIGHYSFVDKGGCNGLALDAKNKVLFAACGRSRNPPAQPAQPMMAILSATDGKILASLPLAGGSDGAAFNPSTMEAFQHAWQWHDDHRQGEEPGEVRGRAEPSDDEWRTHGDVRQQDGPPLHDVAGAGSGTAATTGRRPWRPRHTGPRFVHDSDDRQVRAAILDRGGRSVVRQYRLGVDAGITV